MRSPVIKHKVTPIGLNQISVRFDNLEDLLDYPAGTTLAEITVDIDLEAYA